MTYQQHRAIKGQYAEYWETKKSKLKEYRDSGSVHLEPWGEFLYVSAPYNVEFVSFARSAGAKYHRKTIRWSFLRSQRELLTKYVSIIYGEHALIEKIL